MTTRKKIVVIIFAILGTIASFIIEVSIIFVLGSMILEAPSPEDKDALKIVSAKHKDCYFNFEFPYYVKVQCYTEKEFNSDKACDIYKEYVSYDTLTKTSRSPKYFMFNIFVNDKRKYQICAVNEGVCNTIPLVEEYY